ncbi:MAG: glycoside hydrolase 5 family protein [Anaerolineae bacterium]
MAVIPDLKTIRGFNYIPSNVKNDIAMWRDYDPALVERELTFAQRLGLNSARIWLAYVVYDHDRQAFLGHLRHFVRAAHERGITTMPVVWDSCFSDLEPTWDFNGEGWAPNPGVLHLGADFYPRGERYCADLVETLADEPGLLMWDVMNEPMVTSWVWVPSPDTARRIELLWTFVRHYCAVFQALDKQHAITVGCDHPDNLAVIGETVDILSFHDYSPTHRRIALNLARGLDYAKQFGKPVFVSEISCLARANPYDVSIKACMDSGLGWYLFELMIGISMWGDIHGIIYPDGTVRDPSIVAAVQGFFRKRSGQAVTTHLNKEGAITRVLSAAAGWLAEPAQADAIKPYADGLEALEVMANLMEAGELVPMAQPPSVRVLSLAQDTAEDRQEVARLLTEWGVILRQHAGL